MKEKKYKVTIYNNDRLIVQRNYDHFKGAKVKNRVLPTKTRNKENPFITTKNYQKALKQFRNKLYTFDLVPSKCVFLTLTTTNNMLWPDLKSKFQSFILSIKRNFGKCFYIRAIESHNKDQHFHIHLTIMFENTIPKNFTRAWVNKHWNIGFIDFQYAYDTTGIIDYLTMFKGENRNNEDSTYTKLPQFVQIISYSKNFPIADKQEITTDKQGVCKIIQKANNDSIKETGQDLYNFSDKHKFIDQNTGEIITCIDKQYYHKPQKV